MKSVNIPRQLEAELKKEGISLLEWANRITDVNYATSRAGGVCILGERPRYRRERKLNNEDARLVKGYIKYSNIPYNRIGKMFKVSCAILQGMREGITYKDIDPAEPCEVQNHYNSII